MSDGTSRAHLLGHTVMRRPANKRLRQSEERYRRLVELSPDAIVLADPNGRILAGNAQAAAMFGYAAASELIGRNGHELAAPETRERIVSDVHEDIRAGGVREVDCLSLRRDGSRFPAAVRFTVVADVQGRPEYLILVIRDMTRHKQAEETLRHRAAELAALHATVLDLTGSHDLPALLYAIVERATGLLGAAAGGLYLCDPERQEVRCVVSYHTRTDHTGVILKYGEGSAGRVAQTGQPLIIGDYRAWAGRAQVYEEEQPFTSVLSVPMIWQGQVTGVIHAQEKDNRLRHFTTEEMELLQAFASHAAVAVENVRLYDGLRRELAERKQAEEALQKSEAQLRAQFKGIPVPTYTWQWNGDDLVLVDYNDAAAAVTEGGIAKWLGAAAAEMYAPRSDILADVRRCYAEKRTFQRETPYRFMTTGKENQLLVTYAFVPPDLVLAHAEDITERRRAEAQLAEAQKMEAVGRLAGGMAHFYNNQLTAVIGFAELLLDSLDADDPRRQDVSQILGAASRSAEMTRQILAFSRKQMLRPRPLDLHDDLAIQKSVRSFVGEGIKLAFVTDGRLGQVTADPDQLKLVVEELTRNACNAMPEGGALTFEFRNVVLDEEYVRQHAEATPGRYVMLAISDTGCGMSEEVKARLFEPFFTTKDVGQGDGLGLPFVYGMVKQSGGQIAVESELGRGTTVRVYLPRTD